MQKVGTKYKTCFNIYDTGLVIPATIICGSDTGRQITLAAGIHSREYIGIQALTELAWNSQENRTPMSQTLSGKRVISEASPFD